MINLNKRKKNDSHSNSQSHQSHSNLCSQHRHYHHHRHHRRRHQSYQMKPLQLITIYITIIATSMLNINNNNNNIIYFVNANWIDPDTPKGAYTTKPRVMYVPPPKASNDDDDRDDDDDNDSHHHKHHKTPAPSQSPTTHPTPYPTTSPTTFIDVDDERIYHLVMSDEFNTDGRTFEDGVDPKWTALDKNDYTNGALHYYSPDNVVTKNGDLLIKTEAKHQYFVGTNDTDGKEGLFKKNFKSGMMQSWNKFCFTGGIIEAEIQIPGKAEIGGLWPAFWLLGNMARHTYVGSTNHIWPWSSNACTLVANNAQRINGCMKAQHYGLQKQVGRGAPEIDIFEVQPGKTKANTGIYLESSVGQPFMSASFQVAPGRPNNRPGGGWWPGPGQWYEGLTGGFNTSLNIFFYGDYNHFRGDPIEKDYWSDAVSYNHQLQDKHFERKHKYRLEWELPDEDEGHDGYIRWFVNDRFVLQINGTGIVDAGVGSTVSTEPMYILMNTAISKEWGFPLKCPTNCPCKDYDCLSNNFGETCGFQPDFCKMMKNETDLPTYKVNYVRVWQNKNDPKQKVGCSTPERPTSKYIQAHQNLYKRKGDVSPLKEIQRGNGVCKPNSGGITADSCGGSKRGTCIGSRCECRDGWTGPHCLVPDGFNPIQYEKEEVFADLEFTGPILTWSGLYIGLTFMGALALFAPIIRRRMDGWKPIP
jgi:beta-glucanase (GH16 family)